MINGWVTHESRESQQINPATATQKLPAEYSFSASIEAFIKVAEFAEDSQDHGLDTDHSNASNSVNTNECVTCIKPERSKELVKAPFDETYRKVSLSDFNLFISSSFFLLILLSNLVKDEVFSKRPRQLILD